MTHSNDFSYSRYSAIKAHFGGLLPLCVCTVSSSYMVVVFYLGRLENEPISLLVSVSTAKEETVE